MSSRVYQAELPYSTKDKVKELNEEQYNKLRAICHGKLPEFGKRESYWSCNDLVLDEEELQTISDLGLEVSVHRVRGLVYPTDERHTAINHALNLISVPNVGLFSVVSVMVLEDACTDNLQSYLNDGWRIVAVCPPNDTRRPTYVLGHTEKKP